ncbi:MAG TPA: hypothetical protein VGG92_16385, partial [Caulobacteraceae bacterium]
ATSEAKTSGAWGLSMKVTLGVSGISQISMADPERRVWHSKDGIIWTIWGDSRADASPPASSPSA